MTPARGSGSARGILNVSTKPEEEIIGKMSPGGEGEGGWPWEILDFSTISEIRD